MTFVGNSKAFRSFLFLPHQEFGHHQVSGFLPVAGTAGGLAGWRGTVPLLFTVPRALYHRIDTYIKWPITFTFPSSILVPPTCTHYPFLILASRLASLTPSSSHNLQNQSFKRDGTQNCNCLCQSLKLLQMAFTEPFSTPCTATSRRWPMPNLKASNPLVEQQTSTSASKQTSPPKLRPHRAVED